MGLPAFNLAILSPAKPSGIEFVVRKGRREEAEQRLHERKQGRELGPPARPVSGGPHYVYKRWTQNIQLATMSATSQLRPNIASTTTASSSSLPFILSIRNIFAMSYAE